MKPTISPLQKAVELRAQAEGAGGEARSYLLWLAQEWEKTAARESAPGSAAVQAAVARRALQAANGAPASTFR
jgi:hypothetical protein